MAQPYDHVILPLANDRDRETEVLWGIADFERHFQRKPEALWLPEAAVNGPTLNVLIKHGIRYEPSDMVKNEIYLSFVPLLNSSRVELLDHPKLVSQLCGLERRTARGGRDSIDHPPNAHDDVANAAAGACLLAVGFGAPSGGPRRLIGV
jgi:hypothetical protein